MQITTLNLTFRDNVLIIELNISIKNALNPLIPRFPVIGAGSLFKSDLKMFKLIEQIKVQTFESHLLCTEKTVCHPQKISLVEHI